jgi:hypothetical protein
MKTLKPRHRPSWLIMSEHKALFFPILQVLKKVQFNFSRLTIGKPPYPLYIGCLPPLCKLFKVPKPICCLELDKTCSHKSHTQAADYQWRNKCVIIAAESARNGLFNFILPLRAKVRSEKQMKPIVLLLEMRYTFFVITWPDSFKKKKKFLFSLLNKAVRWFSRINMLISFDFLVTRMHFKVLYSVFIHKVKA